METRSTLDAIGAGECPTESDDNDARHTQAQLAQGQIRTAAGGLGESFNLSLGEW